MDVVPAPRALRAPQLVHRTVFMSKRPAPAQPAFHAAGRTVPPNADDAHLPSSGLLGAADVDAADRNPAATTATVAVTTRNLNHPMARTYHAPGTTSQHRRAPGCGAVAAATYLAAVTSTPDARRRLAQLAGGRSTITQLADLQNAKRHRVTVGSVRRHLIVLERKELVDRHSDERGRLRFTLTDAGRDPLARMPVEPAWMMSVPSFGRQPTH